jgi:hypothetical protein
MVNKCLEYWWALNNNLPDQEFFSRRSLNQELKTVVVLVYGNLEMMMASELNQMLMLLNFK